MKYDFFCIGIIKIYLDDKSLASSSSVIVNEIVVLELRLYRMKDEG